MSDSLQYAMQMQDVDVGKPSRAQAGSNTSQIAGLSVSQSCSVCLQVSADDLENLSPIKKRLSDGAYSSVRSAQRRRGMEGCEFSIETAVALTSSGHIYAFAIITRTK